MKTTKTNENYVSTLDQNSVSFKIAEENQAFIIEALSKNIYRDPIGTIIREYCSNAWDANVEAGVDEPILVQIDSDATGNYFSVTDYGVGLSEERVNNVFVKYGESTKNNDDKGIGGFGIGAKSAFAYTDTFFVNTVHNKVFYKYMLTKTSTNPKMILLDKQETDLPNGTEIRIYLKTNWNEEATFDEKIRRQLLHFRQVIYRRNGKDVDYFIDRKFFDGDGFEIVEGSKSFFPNLYVLLGPVAYPIDFSLIGMNTLPMSIGLKFNIGELDVTLSREEIRYTEPTIALLVQRIDGFKKKLQGYYDDRKWWLKSPVEYYEKESDSNSIEFGEIRVELPSGGFREVKRRKYQVLGVMPDISLPSNGKIPFLYTHAVFDGYSLKFKERDLPKVDYNLLFSGYCDIIILDETSLSRNKLRYRYSTNGCKEIILIKPRKIDFHGYKKLFHWNKVTAEKGNFFKRIMSFKKNFEEKIISHFERLSEIEVSPEFLKELKSLNRKEKIESKIKFNDISRPFGESFRKIRISDGKAWTDNSNCYFLTNCVFVVVEEESMFEMVREMETYEIIKVKKKGNSRDFKRVFFVKPEKEIDLEEMRGIGVEIREINYYIERLKVPNCVKEYARECYFNEHFKNEEWYDFLGSLKLISRVKDRYFKNTKKGKNLLSFYQKYSKIEISLQNYVPNEWLDIKKKMERYKSHFRIFKILNTDIIFGSDKESKEMFVQLLRKHGMYPSLKAWEPIDAWERQLIEEGNKKAAYLQSLNK